MSINVWSYHCRRGVCGCAGGKVKGARADQAFHIAKRLDSDADVLMLPGATQYGRSMRTYILRTTAVIGCLLVGAALCVVQGQGFGGSWSTVGRDAQRTSWVQSDPRISTTTVHGAHFGLLWKMKLDNQARQLSALTQPLLLTNLISYKGFKALAFVGGSSDNVYAIDYDLGKMFWTTHLNEAATKPLPAESLDCPNALMAVMRATDAPQTPSQAAAGPRGRGGTGARGPNTNIYAISSRGMVHTLNPQTGEDLSPPLALVPPGANIVGSILVGTVLYAATANNCGGAPHGVWAVDLSGDVNEVAKWQTGGASVVGPAAPTVGSDGTIYIATGDGKTPSSDSDAVVALEPKTLERKDWFVQGATPFGTTPVAFQYKDRQLLVAANQDGRLYLMDGASLGGPDHRTPLYRTAPYVMEQSSFVPGALASWEESGGTRWVLAPSGGPVHADTKFPISNGPVTNGAIVAFTLVDHDGTLVLQPAWISRDMMSPVPPLVLNGVVFAISGGEYRTNNLQMTARQRAERSKPAILYALDAATGKVLWTSGGAITSFVHGVGPSGGDGQVYVVTHDSTIYAFGIPMEH